MTDRARQVDDPPEGACEDPGDATLRRRASDRGGSSDLQPDRPPPSVVDTLISLAFGFVLAFIFRGYFVEPFVIPTGSMAPTLLGRHVVAGEDHQWAVDIRATERRGAGRGPRFVHDPITAEPDRLLTDEGTLRPDRRARSGERILALKHAYALRDPKRWEVAVFEAPSSLTDGEKTFIKRVVGLPNESVAIVDGDVFVAERDGERSTPWATGLWRIARKPVGVQRAIWQRVYEGDAGAPGSAWLRSEQGTVTTLAWDVGARPISDRNPYNQIQGPGAGDDGVTYHGPFPTNRFYDTHYPVSDLALGARVDVLGQAQSITAEIRRGASGWRAIFRSAGASARGGVVLERRVGDSWETLAERAAPIEAGDTLEFWHVDQALRALVNGRVVAEAGYELSIEGRLALAIGPAHLRTVRGALEEQANTTVSVLSRPGIYEPPRVEWRCSAGVGLGSLTIDRDVWYRPYHNPGAPDGHADLPLATHPSRPADLDDRSFLVLGDNSPASSDSRYWASSSRVVRRALGEIEAGVLPRELLVGRAAMVYLPSPAPPGDRGRTLPGFDLGRIRWIR